ncbi:MAG TPA: hypothetical protein VMD97_10215 [Candidatus Aquilonibacter sp.]|nr:hypothetical protein [Candidatus Aquilonibacter sp.]
MADEAKPSGTAFYRHGDILHSRGEDLEREIFMRGKAAGRLAVAMDALTDALVLVGQHGVYCTSNRNPAVPKLDLQAVLAGIGGAKELVAAAMEYLQRSRTEAK